jgi:hypothetical protein
MAKIQFPGYELSTDVLNGKSVTTNVKPGTIYGHRVHSTQYFGMRSIDIRVDSHLLDSKQLEFNQLGTAWALALHFDAHSIPPVQNQSMTCRFPKMRFQDSINVTVTGDHQGQMALVVDIV